MVDVGSYSQDAWRSESPRRRKEGRHKRAAEELYPVCSVNT